MVAVVGKEVVRGALEPLRRLHLPISILSAGLDCSHAAYLVDYVVYLLLGAEAESMQYVTSECPAGRFESGSRPVDTAYTSSIVAAVGVLFTVDDYSGMEQRPSECP